MTRRPSSYLDQISVFAKFITPIAPHCPMKYVWMLTEPHGLVTVP